MVAAASITQTSGKLQLENVLQQLVQDGYLSEDNQKLLRVIGDTEARRKQHALEVIAERGWANERKPDTKLDSAVLTAWLAATANLPLFTIDPLKIDVQATTSVMSYAYAARFNIMAVEVSASSVTFATAEPWQREWEHELANILNKEIKRVVTAPEEIRRYLLEFYALSRSVLGAEQDQAGGGAVSSIQNLEQLMDLGRAGKLDANDQHVVNIVDWLLQYAFQQRASDIHIEPRRDTGHVRFRIDGVLHQVYDMPTQVMAAVTSRIKILGRMDVAEKRRPQDGRMKTRTETQVEIELRLSTMPTAFGEKLVMRIFDPDVLEKDAAALGFSQRERDVWNDMIDRPHGIILVTGPTGSGKTTTLYTTLKQLAKPEVNVCTIEDPIELVEPSFNQMQVQTNIGLDFASGVRTLMRQDPDIIMVGEIRDLETAEMAIQAALTGHLVLSTLHTNDAPSAITRLLELGVPHYLINSTVIGVLAQRLTRTLCPHCRSADALDENRWKDFVAPWKSSPPKKINQPVGCLECRNTGFLGRTGIYEVFTLDADVKRTITPNCDIDEVRKRAIKQGMVPLRISGAQKVAKGLTTIEEILKVAPAPIELN
ncbi:MAG: GspE/PulE family protein [Pseudomonadota bacterium]